MIEVIILDHIKGNNLQMMLSKPFYVEVSDQLGTPWLARSFGTERHFYGIGETREQAIKDLEIDFEMYYNGLVSTSDDKLTRYAKKQKEDLLGLVLSTKEI